MGFKRGQIFLANFNPGKGSEPGKIRPCLILQSDLLNELNPLTTTVVPLTTQLLDAEPLRFRIGARDNLNQDSDLMLDQIRTLDNQRLIGSVIASLTDRELASVSELIEILLGLQD